MAFDLLTIPNIDELCTLSHLYGSHPNPTGPHLSTIRNAARKLSDEASVLMDYLMMQDKDVFKIDVDAYIEPKLSENYQETKSKDVKLSDPLSGQTMKSDSYITSIQSYLSDAYLQALAAPLLHTKAENYSHIPLHYVLEAITKPKLFINIELPEDPIITSCREAVVSDNNQGRFYNVAVSNAEHAAWFAVRSCAACRISNIFDLVVKSSVYSDLAKREAGVGAPFKIRLAKDVREQARIRCLRRLAFYTQLQVGPTLEPTL